MGHRYKAFPGQSFLPLDAHESAQFGNVCLLDEEATLGASAPRGTRADNRGYIRRQTLVL